MTVLDASAVLALLRREPGSDVVAEHIGGATICTVNLAEVVGKIVDVSGDPVDVVQRLVATGMTIEPLIEDDALLAGALRSLVGGQRLSLGDRCCLALAARSDPPVVLTADRIWKELDIDIDVQLIR